MPAIRADYAQGLIKDGYEYYEDSSQYSPEPSNYAKIAKVRSSDKAWEQATSVIEDSDPKRRAEGEEMQAVKPIEGYTAYGTNWNWYKEIEVENEVIQDHQKMDNFMKKITANWANAFIRGRNKWLMSFYNNGGLTAGHINFNNNLTGNLTDPSGNGVYDGLASDVMPWFNLSGNTRTRKDGQGAYYNGLDLALDGDNFETAWNLGTITNAFNEDGAEVNINFNAILYNPTLNFTVRRLLESTKIPGQTPSDTGVHQQNDINVLERIVTPISDRYFSDTDAWVLMETMKDIEFLERQTPVIEIWYNNKTKTHYMSMEERYGVLIRNWRRHVASKFSTS